MIRRSFQSLSPTIRQRTNGLVLRQRCWSIHPAAAAAATSVWPLSHAQHRTFSDRLLGHSPMAPASMSNIIGGDQSSSRIPTERDVSVAGGVWNPTSAKRDKLAELKGELTEDQETLDDAATDVQKLDLYLADGIQWIVHTVDQTRLPPIVAIMPDSSVSRLGDQNITSSSESESTTTSSCENTSTAATTTTTTTTTTTNPVLPHDFDPTQWDVERAVTEMESWIQEQAATIHSTIPNGQLQQEQWETYLSEVIQKLDELLATLPASRYLRHIRDFYEVPQDSVANQAVTTDTSLQQQLLTTTTSSDDQAALALAGNKILARFRLQLTKATCEHLKESWETLTTLSDEAVDRLAVKAGEHGNNDDEEEDDSNHKMITSLPLDKVNKVIQSSLLGDAIDRVDAWWALVDQDRDGLLEKTEMEQVAISAVTSVQSAIVSLFEEALEAAPLTQLEQDDGMTKKNKGISIQNWRERRRERKAKRRLTKTFQRAVKKHFEDEVEMPHRLRCIYAWAEKSHQDNKVDSVLIEASGWSGRKRYVELQPKISLPEFREVQQVHFTHLDRIGWEITKSFREDLWVEQGKGRQTAELKRDCLLFLLVVSVVDYGIIIL